MHCLTIVQDLSSRVTYHRSLAPSRQSPRPQRQALQRQDLGSDVGEEGDDADDDTDHVDYVVAIMDRLAGSTAVDASLLLGLDGAGEGLRHEVSLHQERDIGPSWVAGGGGEVVDETEHEVPGEGPAQVGDTSTKC